MTTVVATDAYRLLTEQHTLLVVDVETCLAQDGGSNRVISLAVVPIVRGTITGPPRSWLIKPPEAIDAGSFQAHHITDEMLARKLPFRRLVHRIDPVLCGTGTAPDDTSVVFVAHWAGGDAAALRGEYARASRTMPDLPIIDTMRLAAQLDIGVGHTPSLPKLAKHFGIRQRAWHDARDDARVTALIVVELLTIAAAKGWTDLDELLRQHRAGTTLTASGRTRSKPAVEPEPELDAAHLATHAELLPDDAGDADLDTWVEQALDCAKLRCPLLLEKADLAASHAPTLLAALVRRLPEAGDPGQAATLLGAVTALAPHAFPTARGVVSSWDALARHLPAAARCQPGASCPACRTAEPCPLDTAHHAFARAYIGDPVTAGALNAFVGVGDDRGLDTWVRNGRRQLAAHAAWRVIDQLVAAGNASRASAVLHKATQYGLELDDPRLALAQAGSLALQGDIDTGATLAIVSLKVRTTDDGYDLLESWLHGPCEELRRRAAQPQDRPPRKVRTARPPGRERPNRFKL